MINVNQITAQLAKMPDQALQQYAAMHKNDPYTVTLALSESNRRKQMRMGAQGAGAMPQPKVVDQDIAQMSPPPQQQALPEESGIGQLPAQNMQNMAGGGIVAFDDGGSPADKINYREYALNKARQLGLNPSLVDNIFKTESGYDPIAKSGTGPVGIGQISKFIGRSIFGQRNGIDPDSIGKTNDGRLDPIKNINTSLDFMAHLNRKYKGDPTKISVAYNQGEPVLDKHLKENNGKVVPSDLPSEARNYISKTLTNLMPFSVANAKEVPTNPAIDQIPGQSSKAPPAKTGITALTASDDTFTDPMTGFSPTQAPVGERPSYFSKEGARQAMLGVGDLPYALAGSFADIGNAGLQAATLGRYKNAEPTLGSAHLKRLATEYLGREAESADPTMRNMRTAGEVAGTFINPVTGLRTAATKTEAGLNALFGAQKAKEAEAVAAAPTKLPPRLTPPEVALPITPAGQATASVVDASQAGRSAQESQKALEATRMANQARDQLAAEQAAARAAAVPKIPELAKAASPAENAVRAAQLAGETATQAEKIPTPVFEDTGIQTLVPNDNIQESVFDPTYGGKMPIDTGGVNPLEETKTAEVPKKDGTDWNDFMIKMGLNLMASKDPNAISGVGQAGLGTLAMQQAEAKAKTEDEYRKAMGLEAGSKAKFYEANAASIERGAKEKNLQLEAEKLIAQEISKDKFLGMPGNEAMRTRRETELRANIYRQLGIEPTMAAGAPRGGAKFIGFENPA
jgi:soluble lytic murein transglycosylase-like protein